MKPMRILAIDGGGMKGVFACSYLQTMEEHFGKGLCEHFDLIAGTSTGGIIALGIAAGKTAAEIAEFYREHGPAIFPEPEKAPKSKVARSLRDIVGLKKRLDNGYWYPNEPLEGALRTVLSDGDANLLTMADARTRLLIPAVNAQNAYPRVFKSHKGEPQVSHLDRDYRITMVDVALATAAAPWYLPIAKIDESGTPFTYIDGGLWANNPAQVAVTEAFTYYVGPEREFGSIQLLSVALPSSSGFSNDGRYQRGRQFIDQLLAYAMESSKHGTHESVKFLLREAPNVYARVRPKNLTEEQSVRLRLDAASGDAVGELMMLGRDQAQHDKNLAEIRSIFT